MHWVQCDLKDLKKTDEVAKKLTSEKQIDAVRQSPCTYHHKALTRDLAHLQCWPRCRKVQRNSRWNRCELPPVVRATYQPILTSRHRTQTPTSKSITFRKCFSLSPSFPIFSRRQIPALSSNPPTFTVLLSPPPNLQPSTRSTPIWDQTHCTHAPNSPRYCSYAPSYGACSTTSLGSRARSIMGRG